MEGNFVFPSMTLPISPTAVAAPVLLLILAGCGRPAGRLEGPALQSSESVELGNTESTRAVIRMGAGELRVRGGSAKLLEADFSYTLPGGKPRVEYRATGSRARLNIEQPGGMRGGGSWDLRFNDTQPLELETHFGAGEVKLDLSSVTLRSLEINMGVGELDLDLRGKPKRDYDVRVHGGVGEATIRLPKDVGIKAEARGGIGEIEMRGLEKRGNRWVNPGHEDGDATIHLSVAGGVGAIRVLAE